MDFVTADGTAKMSDNDYLGSSGSVEFAPGQTSERFVGALVNGDTAYEPNETFFMNLSNPTGAPISDAQGIVTITNDDPLPDSTEPTLSVGHTRANANGWNNTSPVTLNVSASDSGSGLAGAPTCKDGTTDLTLTAGSTAGTWTASVSGAGTHSINCSVGDKAGNSKSATDTVELDTTAPSVSSCSVTPSKLSTSANNHKLVTITATVKFTDSGSEPDGFTLVSVTSNQKDSGLAKDDVPNDIQGWTTGTDDTSGQLRAERYGSDRIYTLIYQGKDKAGNTKNCQATVRVPKGG